MRSACLRDKSEAPADPAPNLSSNGDTAAARARRDRHAATKRRDEMAARAQRRRRQRAAEAAEADAQAKQAAEAEAARASAGRSPSRPRARVPPVPRDGPHTESRRLQHQQRAVELLAESAHAERAKARRQADREEVVAALEKTSERSKGAVRSAQSSARSKRKQMLLAAREAWSADEGHALRVPVAPVEPPADGDGAASDSTGIASDLE